MEPKTVGEIVRLLRSRRDLEQIELARACGWRDASAVSRIETDRISPTRKTLVKLASSLADGASTGSAEDIRSWLFLAAGILPTPEDVERVSTSLPAIEGWSQPALIMDFGWFVWRANHFFRHWLGLPPKFEGLNVLQLVFSGVLRRHLGDAWEPTARETLLQFRGETAYRDGQRWYRALLAELQGAPDFARLWNDVTPPDPRDVRLRVRKSERMGSVSIIRHTLIVDPRLSLAHVVPDDARATEMIANVFSNRGALAPLSDIG